MTHLVTHSLGPSASRSAKRSLDGFVTASGSVDGIRLHPRDIYWRRWLPWGSSHGRVVVVSPGLGERGIDYAALCEHLASEGFDVFAMDHQWCGYSEGEVGQFDRGFGVARDVAAVTAYADAVRRRDYGDDAPEVLLVGSGLGASAGVLSALVLNEHYLLKLDGMNMPVGLSSLLLAPLLNSSKEVPFKLLQTVGRMPWVGKLASGLSPHESRSLDALARAGPDLGRVRSLIDKGPPPQGLVRIIHGSDDPLACPASSRRLAQTIGGHARVRMLKSSTHSLVSNPETLSWVARAVADLEQDLSMKRGRSASI